MKTVLCYGDSNTHGTSPMETLLGGDRFPPEHRWPHVMAGILGDGVRVIDEGLPGRTTVHDDPIEGEDRNGMRMLRAILQSHAPVDLLVIFLGTNDLKLRFAVPGFDIALSIARLAEVALASGHVADVLLVTPPKARALGCLEPMFAGCEERFGELPTHLQAVAAHLGTGYLDAGAHIAVDPMDGIHYSADAQVTLGRVMAKAVAARLKETS
jgi:lysophospholipase L1-like esterase